jgi:hypothetical protein
VLGAGAQQLGDAPAQRAGRAAGAFVEFVSIPQSRQVCPARWLVGAGVQSAQVVAPGPGGSTSRRGCPQLVQGPGWVWGGSC